MRISIYYMDKLRRVKVQGHLTQRKTDIEANERRSLKQKNIHSVITKQK